MRAVLVAGIAAIRNIEQRLAISAPHRPQLFRAAGWCYAFIGSRAAIERSQQPDFRLIDVTVAFTPPLAGGNTARGKGKRLSIRRGRAEELVGVTIGADEHRRAAGNADAMQIIEIDVATARGEIDPAAVLRPRIELIETIVKRETF